MPTELTSAIATMPGPSPLVLCDRLISLAQEADRAGFASTAGQLVQLAHTVLDEPYGRRLRA